MFEILAERAEANANVVLQRSFGPLLVEVLIDEASEYLRIDKDGVAVSREPPSTPPDLRLLASAEAWRELASAEPGPGYQTLSAMRRIGALVVEGDLLKFHRHLLLLEMLFVLLKAPAERRAPPLGVSYVEPVVGRYLRLDFEGRPHRVYFEEAGEGIPLLCLRSSLTTRGSFGSRFRSHIQS